MLFDLSQLREARTHVARTYEPSAFAAGDEDAYRVVEPVQLDFDVQKAGTQFRVVGKVRTALALNCGRCLEDFTMPVDASFDLLYLPHAENQGEGEVEVEDEDLSTAYYSDEEIDLGQLMREQFYLALPMKPLCRESCRGLCPQCGTNLNSGTCDCSPTWTDPRLEGLRALSDKGGDREV
jgi:uncharacterized protein